MTKIVIRIDLKGASCLCFQTKPNWPIKCLQSLSGHLPVFHVSIFSLKYVKDLASLAPKRAKETRCKLDERILPLNRKASLTIGYSTCITGANYQNYINIYLTHLLYLTATLSFTSKRKVSFCFFYLLYEIQIWWFTKINKENLNFEKVPGAFLKVMWNLSGADFSQKKTTYTEIVRSFTYLT